MSNPDASREAAHRRVEQAQQIADQYGGSPSDYYGELYWNTDWTPDQPTHQQVMDNWDYYSQITNGGTIPLRQAIEQQNQQSNVAGTYWNDYSGSGGNQAESPVRTARDVMLQKTDLEMQQDAERAQAISEGLDKIGGLLQSSAFTSGWKPNEDQEKQEEKKPEQELDPRFENNPRYLEMMSGVSDMGVQSIPEEERQFSNDIDYGGAANALSDAWNFVTDPHAMDRLLLGEGPLNPDNWPIIGSTDAEKRQREEQKQYREANPKPEGAITYIDGKPQLSDEYKKIYQDYFDSKGGLQQGYVTGLDDVMRGLSMSMAVNPEHPELMIDINEPKNNPSNLIFGGLDKLANENYDDGTMRADSVKGKYMSGKQYLEYQDLGMGGRPRDEIDPNATYNKLEEMGTYNFIPYIEDDDQYMGWNISQLPDNVTKAYNIFGDTRDRYTDAKINYGGQQYGRENFYDHVGDYFKDIDEIRNKNKMEILSPDDPSINEETDLPMTVWWSFPGTDIQVPSDQELQYLWSDDGSKLYVWLPGYEDQAVEYYGIEDYNAHTPEWGTYRAEEGDPVHQYWRIPKLEYTQDDGTEVSLPYSAVEEMAQSMANGTADMDWGPLNIAKDASDRKGFGDMVATGDFSDLVPNMVDLTTGSAPLFTPYTAWPMAIANAGTATQGLDPRLWDSKTNTYHRLSDDMTGEKYLSNIALSGLVPATERIAGGIGGSGGVLGRPLQAGLTKIGAPAAAHSALDVLGEGAEESVASAWEDYQVNGLGNWFANPVYETDDEGNVITEYNPVTQRDEPKKKYDNSGHEVRDPNTSVGDRLANWWAQQPDNFFAGTALGLGIGGPRIAHDAMTGSGYYGEAREQKLLRELEKLNGLPRFREAKRGNVAVNIGPEDIGTYGKREE